MPTSGSKSGTSGGLLKPEEPGSSPPGNQEATVITTRAPMEVASASVPAPSAGTERLGPGSRLGHFELLECVGGGGMGRVFRAYDSALGRTVAVKVLSPEQAADGEVLLRFRHEAQTAARLNHENIVQVYHVGDAQGLPYIVFEFIEGLNIRALVERKGVLPLAEAVSYTFQVAEALAHAAAQNVVHRDIKPSNILITTEGHAKLIDLGLARLHKISAAVGDLTASGVTLGTFDYISPEQARDPRTADVRSDIYSLGCTLFYMLAGRPPFPEGTVLQKLLQHQGEEPPDVRQFRPELPPETSRLLRKMMAKDPRRRFQSAQQLIEALVVFAEQLGLQPAAPGERSWVSGVQPPLSLYQRHLPWIAPVAVLAVAVVLLNILWASPPSPRDLATDWIGSTGEEQVGPPEPRSGVKDENRGVDPGVAGPGAVAQADAGTVSRPENAPRGSPASESGTGMTPTSVAPAKAAGATSPEAAPSAAPVAATSGPPSPTGVRPDLPGPETPGPEPGAPGATAIASANPPHAASAEVMPATNSASLGPAESPPASAKQGEGLGVLVVDPVGSGPNQFATLSAACAAAATGDVVVLRFNGPRQEEPVALNNLKLTIRAAEGYQPVVTFRPGELDPMNRPRAMIRLSGSQLTLVSVTLVLEVPREAVSEQWSLVESRPAEMVRLEKCSLTIDNTSTQSGAYHPDVAFFRVRAAPGAGSLIAGEGTPVARRTAIALADCVLRGEAVVVRAQDLWPFEFSWENGLLVTTERLLAADGGERVPAAGESIRISLQHVTAVVRAGLCRFSQGSLGPRLLSTQVDCRNSILAGGPAASLVEHLDATAVDAARQGFAWNGDRNFYEGFSNFWSIRVAASSSAEVMPFEAWREYWGAERESVPNWNRVQWRQLPAADRPVPAQLPSDYALNPSTTSANAAIGAASDGRDVGCLFDRLPEVASPPQPAATPDPPAQPESDPGPPKGA